MKSYLKSSLMRCDTNSTFVHKITPFICVIGLCVFPEQTLQYTDSVVRLFKNDNLNRIALEGDKTHSLTRILKLQQLHKAELQQSNKEIAKKYLRWDKILKNVTMRAESRPQSNVLHTSNSNVERRKYQTQNKVLQHQKQIMINVKSICLYPVLQAQNNLLDLLKNGFIDHQFSRRSRKRYYSGRVYWRCTVNFAPLRTNIDSNLRKWLLMHEYSYILNIKRPAIVKDKKYMKNPNKCSISARDLVAVAHLRLCNILENVRRQSIKPDAIYFRPVIYDFILRGQYHTNEINFILCGQYHTNEINLADICNTLSHIHVRASQWQLNLDVACNEQGTQKAPIVIQYVIVAELQTYLKMKQCLRFSNPTLVKCICFMLSKCFQFTHHSQHFKILQNMRKYAQQTQVFILELKKMSLVDGNNLGKRSMLAIVELLNNPGIVNIRHTIYITHKAKPSPKMSIRKSKHFHLKDILKMVIRQDMHVDTRTRNLLQSLLRKQANKKQKNTKLFLLNARFPRLTNVQKFQTDHLPAHTKTHLNIVNFLYNVPSVYFMKGGDVIKEKGHWVKGNNLKESSRINEKKDELHAAGIPDFTRLCVCKSLLSYLNTHFQDLVSSINYIPYRGRRQSHVVSSINYIPYRGRRQSHVVSSINYIPYRGRRQSYVVMPLHNLLKIKYKRKYQDYEYQQKGTHSFTTGMFVYSVGNDIDKDGRRLVVLQHSQRKLNEHINHDSRAVPSSLQFSSIKNTSNHDMAPIKMFHGKKTVNPSLPQSTKSRTSPEGTYKLITRYNASKTLTQYDFSRDRQFSNTQDGRRVHSIRKANKDTQAIKMNKILYKIWTILNCNSTSSSCINVPESGDHDTINTKSNHFTKDTEPVKPLYKVNRLQLLRILSNNDRKQNKHKLRHGYIGKNQHSSLNIIITYPIMNMMGQLEKISMKIRKAKRNSNSRIERKIRRKRENNYVADTDSLIKSNIIKQLSNSWVDLKEKMNELEKDIYKTEEYFTYFEEELHMLIKRGDKIASLEDKLNAHNKLKTEVAHEGFNFVEKRFHRLQNEIYQLQKEQENAEKDFMATTAPVSKKIIMDSTEGKQRDDENVNSLLLAHRSKTKNDVGKHFQVIEPEYDNAVADDSQMKDVNDTVIAKQLNLLGGFLDYEIYDPDLVHIDNAVHAILVRSKRNIFVNLVINSEEDVRAVVADAEGEVNQHHSMRHYIIGNNIRSQRKKRSTENSPLEDAVPSQTHDTFSNHISSQRNRRGKETPSLEDAVYSQIHGKFSNPEYEKNYEYFAYPDLSKFLANPSQPNFKSVWSKIRNNASELQKSVHRILHKYYKIQAGVHKLKTDGDVIEYNISQLVSNNNSARHKFTTAKWEIIKSNLATLKNKIHKYNKAYEKNTINAIIQNVNDKMEVIHKELNNGRGMIEAQIDASPDPSLLFPFSPANGARWNIKISTFDTDIKGTNLIRGHMKHSHNEDYSDLKSIDSLNTHGTDIPINSDLAHVDSVLTNLLIARATGSVHGINKLDVSNPKRSIRVKRRSRTSRPKKRKYKVGKYGRRHYSLDNIDLDEDIPSSPFPVNMALVDNLDLPIFSDEDFDTYERDYHGSRATNDVYNLFSDSDDDEDILIEPDVDIASNMPHSSDLLNQIDYGPLSAYVDGDSDVSEELLMPTEPVVFDRKPRNLARRILSASEDDPNYIPSKLEEITHNILLNPKILNKDIDEMKSNGKSHASKGDKSSGNDNSLPEKSELSSLVSNLLDGHSVYQK